LISHETDNKDGHRATQAHYVCITVLAY